MRREVQTELLRRLRRVSEDPSVELSAAAYSIDARRYRDPAQLERERDALFRRRPQVVAHVSELDDNDFVTVELAGASVLLVRDADRGARVFLNVCRHRGSRLVSAGCGHAKAFTCPYHAWSYGLDGELIHVPQQDLFSEFDASAYGLVELACEVRYGFVWTVLDQSRSSVGVSDDFGQIIDDDLQRFRLDQHVLYRKVELERSCNWKLIIDAFAEGYHVKSLHKKTLARFFTDAVLIDDFSPHARQVGGRRSLFESSAQPEELDIREHATVFYNLFPNTVLVFHPDYLSALTVHPLGPERSRFVHRMLVPKGLESEAERWEKTFDLIEREVFEKEDLAIAESIQSGLGSGANDRFVAGGLEKGLEIFHGAIDEALRSQS